MFDVIVVGGGPGGSIAAKRCVQSGLKTLLLEKKNLPREKVCSGVIMGPWAKNLTEEEFGQIPQDVLVAPHYLSGCMLHAPGVKPQKVDYRMPVAWRKDLDYWMSQKAKDKGVEIWDQAKVIAVSQRDGECIVELEMGRERQELKARFVIGADGAQSTVRTSIFPKLEVRYRRAYRECYPGELNLDKEYWHWVFPLRRFRPRFDVIYKGDFFLLEGGVKELKGEIRRILGDYGFDPNQKPLWRDGCIGRALLHQELLSGSFLPARGNVLLVGDAASLVMPVTGEGIGTALKSGLSAAESINKAIKLNKEPAEIYLRELNAILAAIEGIQLQEKKAEEEAAKGAQALLDAFREGLQATLKVT